MFASRCARSLALASFVSAQDVFLEMLEPAFKGYQQEVSDGDLFSNPSFGDAPYHAVISAIGGREKVLASYQGPMRKIYASNGATGFGRKGGFGESVAVGRPGESTLMLRTLHYDSAMEAPTVLLSETFSDEVRLETRSVAVDDDSEEEQGFIVNVTVVNMGSSLRRVNFTVSVDLLDGAYGSAIEGEPVQLLSASGKPLVCAYPTGPDPILARANGLGHAASHGMVPLLTNITDDEDYWLRTLALSGPYPGQAEVPGGTVAPLSYRLPLGNSSNRDVYLAIATGVAPGLSDKVTMTIDGSVSRTVSTEDSAAIYYIKAKDVDGDGALSVDIASGGHVAALWAYAVQELKAAGKASCDVVTGRDTRQNNVCPQVTACDTAATGQLFRRGASDPQARDLSFADNVGTRSWLNLEEYSSSTSADMNGPVVVYPKFVGENVWCDGRNQFWNFTESGQIVNELSGQCLTVLPSPDGSISFVDQAPCITPAPLEQQWDRLPTGQDGQIRSALGGCLDGTPGVPKPGPPSDLGELLSFVDTGSPSDIPHDTPVIRFEVSVAAGASVTALLHLPAGTAASKGSGSTCAAMPAALWQATQETWRQRLSGVTAGFQVPSIRTRRALQVAVQQLVMMTERQHDGLRMLKGPIHYYGSDPYDTFRATTAFQRLGLLDLSQRILSRQLQRRCKNGMWEMWEDDNTPQEPGFYIVQGLASKAVFSHFEFSRNGTWLKEAYPALNGTAWATAEVRAACACDGLLPKKGGDGGLPSGHIYVQEAGALHGIELAAAAAENLGHGGEADALNAEAAAFRKSLLASLTANVIEVEGFGDVLPMYPGMSASEFDCCTWGAVDVVYPFPLVAAEDDVVTQSVDLWSSPARTGQYGLHLDLGYSKHQWAYLSADIGHIHLLQGNFSGAWRVFEAMLNSSSPTVATYEEFEVGPMPKTMWGGIPDIWYTAELVNLWRDCLVFERPGPVATLLLLHAAPTVWYESPLSLREVPTSFGCAVSLELPPRRGVKVGQLELHCGNTLEPAVRVVHVHVGLAKYCNTRFAERAGIKATKRIQGQKCVLELALEEHQSRWPKAIALW